MSPRFFQYSCGLSGFLGPIFQNRPTVDVQPPKEQKRQKTAFLIKIGRRFFHFLDAGREMIFDCPSGLSWGLTGEGGAGVWPAAGTEERIEQPSFSSMETDISPFSKFKWWRSSAGRTILPNPSIARKYRAAITSWRLDFRFPSGLSWRAHKQGGNYAEVYLFKVMKTGGDLKVGPSLMSSVESL